MRIPEFVCGVLLVCATAGPAAALTAEEQQTIAAYEMVSVTAGTISGLGRESYTNDFEQRTVTLDIPRMSHWDNMRPEAPGSY